MVTSAAGTCPSPWLITWGTVQSLSHSHKEYLIEALTSCSLRTYLASLETAFLTTLADSRFVTVLTSRLRKTIISSGVPCPSYTKLLKARRNSQASSLPDWKSPQTAISTSNIWKVPQEVKGKVLLPRASFSKDYKRRPLGSKIKKSKSLKRSRRLNSSSSLGTSDTCSNRLGRKVCACRTGRLGRIIRTSCSRIGCSRIAH